MSSVSSADESDGIICSYKSADKSHLPSFVIKSSQQRPLIPRIKECTEPKPTTSYRDWMDDIESERRVLGRLIIMCLSLL
ncbi:hypothetical protein CU097_006092 [Rhizopus azygosporus]|uniref:Uncharacterized protein n=1 Tax=Rhizopus azygosporus TaxID=86630 RepID=A0A367K3Z3_RHIAZ|nr:hypothetical protein CU097_006092 [Rhizopus azygosporus]